MYLPIVEPLPVILRNGEGTLGVLTSVVGYVPAAFYADASEKKKGKTNET